MVGSTARVVTSSRAAITNSQYHCRERLLQSALQTRKHRWAPWYQWSLLVLVVMWERYTELKIQTEEWEKRKPLFLQQQYFGSRFIVYFFLPARPFVPCLRTVWCEQGKKDIQATLYKSFFPQISQTSLCGCKGSSLALWNGHCLPLYPSKHDFTITAEGHSLCTDLAMQRLWNCLSLSCSELM